jgi:hypothetical protein
MSTADVVDRHLGPPGRLVSRSKSGYRMEFPDHLVVWNAQVFVGGETLWRGDLDLSVDESGSSTFLPNTRSASSLTCLGSETASFTGRTERAAALAPATGSASVGTTTRFGSALDSFRRAGEGRSRGRPLERRK